MKKLIHRIFERQLKKYANIKYSVVLKKIHRKIEELKIPFKNKKE